MEVIRLPRSSVPNGPRVLPLGQIIDGFLEPYQTDHRDDCRRGSDVPFWQIICGPEHQPCNQNDGSYRWQKQIAVRDRIRERQHLSWQIRKEDPVNQKSDHGITFAQQQGEHKHGNEKDCSCKLSQRGSVGRWDAIEHIIAKAGE